MASMYYWRSCPTAENGGLESCAWSGGDAGGLCVHRFYGIKEFDAPQVWNERMGWSLTAAYAVVKTINATVDPKAVVNPAVNLWLAKYGQFLPKPCSHLPCP